MFDFTVENIENIKKKSNIIKILHILKIFSPYIINKMSLNQNIKLFIKFKLLKKKISSNFPFFSLYFISLMLSGFQMKRKENNFLIFGCHNYLEI